MIALGYDRPMTVKKKRVAKMGPHLRSAQWVQAVVDYHGKSVEDFAEMADMSRGGVNKLLYGQQRIRWDSLEKLKAVAPPTLKDFDAWMRGDTPSGETGESGEDVTGPYKTKQRDAAIVAEELDGIEDPYLRRKARNAALKCIEEIIHGPPPPPAPGDGGNGRPRAK